MEQEKLRNENIGHGKTGQENKGQQTKWEGKKC